MLPIRRALLKYGLSSVASAGMLIPADALSSPVNATDFSGGDDRREGPFYDLDTGMLLAQRRSIVVGWNQVLLEAVRKSFYPPPIAARTMAMLNSVLFDIGHCLPGSRNSTHASFGQAEAAERSMSLLRLALSRGASVTLKALFPACVDDIDAYTDALALDERVPGAVFALRIGEAAAQRELAARAHDGSNMLGDLNPGPYSDYTGYTPVNTPTRMLDPDRWQPLAGQACLCPHWGRVKPVSLVRGSELRPPPPATIFSPQMLLQLQELVDLNASLTPEQITICRYWGDGSRVTWMQFAQLVCYHKRLSLRHELRLYRAISYALHDAMIATWDAKIAFDSARPISAIRTVYAGRTLRNWRDGLVEVPGESWAPLLYTPPFPEYVSAHSTAGHAACAVLEHFAPGPFRIRQRLGATGSLEWDSFGHAAAQAAYSRRLGGLHFKSGDLVGRALGARIGRRVVALFG